MIKKNIKYTTIIHSSRKKLNIGFIEYCILDSIMKTQKNGYSWMSKAYIAEFLGISERHVFDCIKKLETLQYIEKSDNGKKIRVVDSVIDTIMYEESSYSEEETMKIVHTNYEESSYNNNINNNINNKNIINIERGIKTNNLLMVFKSEVEKRNKMFVPNSKMDRINMSNLSKNKDIIRILELKQFDLSTFITKIFELSDKIDFWKEHPIDNTSTFYRNWAKILNQSSLTLKPQRSKEELERIKSDLLNNF